MTTEQPESMNPTESVADDNLVTEPEVATDATPPVDADAVREPEPDGETVDGEAAAEDQPVVEEEPDWKDRYLRSVAELDNVRKRARRDAAAGEVRGITRLAKELLPAVDNLDRAIQHVGESEGGDEQLVEGLRIVHRELHSALAQAGIESYDPTGQEFDPRFHEAMTTAPAEEGVLPGTVTITYQVGYRRGDDVIRAAKVVVAG